MMKQKKVALLAGVAAMALGATSANALTSDGYAGGGAGVTVTVTNLGVPDWDSYLLAGYHGWQVNISSSQSIGGVDLNSTGYGITVPAYQVWTYSTTKAGTTYNPTPTFYEETQPNPSTGAQNPSWDSVLMLPLPSPDSIIGLTASETNDISDGKDATYAYGVGTLNGYWGYNGVYPGRTTWNIAYLVLPDTLMQPVLNGTGTVTLGHGAAAVGTDVLFDIVAGAAAPPAIPLPMGVYMGMAGLGLVGVYARKRRQA